MTKLHVAYHTHFPGGYLKIEVVRGDEREMLTSDWNRAAGEARAKRYAEVIGCAALEAPPCEECQAHLARLEADQKTIKRPSPPKESQPAPAPRPGKSQAPASANVNPDEAPAC